MRCMTYEINSFCYVCLVASMFIKDATNSYLVIYYVLHHFRLLYNMHATLNTLMHATLNRLMHATLNTLMYATLNTLMYATLNTLMYATLKTLKQVSFFRNSP